MRNYTIRIKEIVLLTCLTILFTTAFAAPNDTHRSAGLIDRDTTITVPGLFPGGFQSGCTAGAEIDSIQTALSCLSDTVISDKATVTIRVTQNNMNHGGETIEVKHPNGVRIHLVGDCGGHACILQFGYDHTGIIARDGHVLGLLENFTLRSRGEGKYGVLANNGGTIILGNVTVRNFINGIETAYSANIRVASDKEVKIHATGNVSGIVAEANSSMEIPNAVSEGNSSHDYYVGSASFIRMSGAQGGSLLVSNNGVVSCSGADIADLVAIDGGRAFPANCANNNDDDAWGN